MLTTLSLAGIGCSRDAATTDQPFKLPPLPYPMDALEPYLSEETLQYHYGKHHQGYVHRANRLVADTRLAKQTLVEVMRASFQPNSPKQSKIFNNAAQAYNHALYWRSMQPDGGGEPAGLMGEWVDKSFGSYRSFRETFVDAARSQFGSGWTWIVLKDNRLEVTTTANAITPIVNGLQPLLVLDLWEHAYYLDYKNQRDQYIEAFLDHLLNWDFAASRLGET
jgi:Fe-Mn family superoxide dismutase